MKNSPITHESDDAFLMDGPRDDKQEVNVLRDRRARLGLQRNQQTTDFTDITDKEKRHMILSPQIRVIREIRDEVVPARVARRGDRAFRSTAGLGRG
jgi:hypothetical protein